MILSLIFQAHWQYCDHIGKLRTDVPYETEKEFSFQQNHVFLMPFA